MRRRTTTRWGITTRMDDSQDYCGDEVMMMRRRKEEEDKDGNRTR